MPEGHAIRKGDRLYYAFYTRQAGDHFVGSVELRGLEERSYQLSNYVTGQGLGIVQGPRGVLQVTFDGSLLIEAAPR